MIFIKSLAYILHTHKHMHTQTPYVIWNNWSPTTIGLLLFCPVAATYIVARALYQFLALQQFVIKSFIINAPWHFSNAGFVLTLRLTKKCCFFNGYTFAVFNHFLHSYTSTAHPHAQINNSHTNSCLTYNYCLPLY